MNFLELQIRGILDKAANNELEGVPDDILDSFAAECREVLKKQFTKREDKEFRLSFSKVGSPTCQLQMEKSGTEPERNSYDFTVKMITGGLLEAFLTAAMKMTNIKVDECQTKVDYDLPSGENVRGTLDYIIDGKVYDAKTASPFAYDVKFINYESLEKNDPFGYVDQLYGYAAASGKPVGGWIVINKASGEIKVVEAPDNPKKVKEAQDRIKKTFDDMEQPFKRLFEPEEETYYKKPTGFKVLGSTCSWCRYKTKCWPEAEFRASTTSKAANPKFNWYLPNDNKKTKPKVEPTLNDEIPV